MDTGDQQFEAMITDPRFQKLPREQQMQLVQEYKERVMGRVSGNFEQKLQSVPTAQENIDKSAFNNPLAEAGRTAFQVGQGAISNLPQNIAENPTTMAMSGIPGVQGKSGSDMISNVANFFGFGKERHPETTAFSDKYMKPQTTKGKVIGGIGNFLTSLINPTEGVSSIANTIHEYPTNVVTEMRPVLAKYMKAKSAAWDAEKASLFQKAGKSIPAEDVMGAYQQIIDNPNLMGSLIEGTGDAGDVERAGILQQYLKDAINRHYGEAQSRFLKKQPFSPEEVHSNALELQSAFDKSGFGRDSHFAGKIGDNLDNILSTYVPGYADLQANYGNFAKARNFANRTIQPWMKDVDPYNTGKAVKSLTSINKDPAMMAGFKNLQQTVPGMSDVGNLSTTQGENITGLGDFVKNMQRYNSAKGVTKSASNMANTGGHAAMSGLATYGLIKLLGHAFNMMSGRKPMVDMPSQGGIQVESNS